jgi:hypothetical protein
MTALRTKYKKSVQPVPESPPKSGLFVLKESTTNKKLGSGGKFIRKGRYRGMPLYSLTLEERATCWEGCPNLDLCYGDNMPFAKRYEPGPALEQAIETDLAALSTRHPDGFVVRLHVLGDFYSVAYVQHWEQMLLQFPALRIFGYTHWPYAHPIGQAVTGMATACPDRVALRRSDRTDSADPLPGAMTIARDAEPYPNTVVCPEQTGQTESCTTCGLCMNTKTAVSFIDHSRRTLKVLPLAA